MNTVRTTAVVVVTFNRRVLLEKCISALMSQSAAFEHLILIDNASTDGTRGWVRESGLTDDPRVDYICLESNKGGAGGFAAGLAKAVELGADWAWIMDDDAEPHANALEELLSVAVEPGHIYGSLAVSGEETSWTTTLVGETRRTVERAADVPASSQVQSLPFLGFMIHRETISRIGLPDTGYFIAADDIEYCLRAERAGVKIIIAGKSRIEHPKSQRYLARLPGKPMICLQLPPWKRYYDTRNRLLIARKYYGFRLLTHTIPGSFVRLTAALLSEPRKLAQLWAFSAGFLDGLLGLKGRRHAKWGISQ
ncbi:GT2 family glycosyltransferase [Luteibacter rhizovicinus]|uniref:GT2 family glycosyltransferase n=1 Tax=Luteibacter rhizovicinus TaxID=242606 RepID=A0A4R3YR92_9GAMM|nr:glycosyltransferase [Luteibacter rhizovicinus]TCV94960.1 GT2 family glycosyltransferase [Luteibacter rhizovicinus]